VSTVDALQATLAHEHAAVFVLSTLAARTSRSKAPALHAEIDAAHADHRARRNQLVLLVSDLGATPEAALPAYEVDRAEDAASLRTAAAALERTSSEVYAALVASTSGDDRTWAVAALTSAAVRGVRLGSAPLAWPGAPELA